MFVNFLEQPRQTDSNAVFFGFSFLVYAGLGCALLVAIFSFVRSLYLLLFFLHLWAILQPLLLITLFFLLREANIITVTVTVLLYLIWALDNLFYYFFLLDFTVYSYKYYDKYQADYKPFTVLHSAHSWLEYGAIISLFYNEYSGTR